MRYDLRLEAEGWVIGVATDDGECGLCGAPVEVGARLGYNATERLVACGECVGTVRPVRYLLCRDGRPIYRPAGGMSLREARRVARTFPGEVTVEPMGGRP